MNQFRSALEDQTADERLGDTLFATVQYIPPLSILVAIGFLIIYFISQAGLIGNPSWQLLAVTGVVLSWQYRTCRLLIWRAISRDILLIGCMSLQCF